MNLIHKVVCILSILGLTQTAVFAGPTEDLAKALAENDARKVAPLLKSGANPNVVMPDGTPLLIVALRENAFAAAEQLLINAQFKHIDWPNAHGETPMMYAALKGQVEIAKKMRALGAEVNREGWAPLHYAASNNHVAMVKWLADEDAYLDTESPNGTTPLMMAARSKFRETIVALIEAGADPSYRNGAGLSAADYAAKAGDAELAAWLTRREADFLAKYPREK